LRVEGSDVQRAAVSLSARRGDGTGDHHKEVSMKTMARYLVGLLAVCFLAACGGGGGKTVKLFATTHGKADPSGSILVLLSPDDGSFISTIGSVGYQINGLTYDATRDKLYGSTSWNDPEFPYGLLEIDMETGVATTIGYAGVDIQTPTVNSDGEMYGWSESEVAGDDNLISIDPATGLATPIGDSGIGTARYGLSFDNGDILYLVNEDNGQINTIDTESGEATYYSTIGVMAHHGDFHPETNHYWGIDSNYNDGPTKNLVVVDISTPEVLETLPTVDNLHAIAFYYH
jgi:hypothetical protein